MGIETDTTGGIQRGRFAFAIANGNSQSDSVEVGHWIPNAIEMPAAWDPADITFLGSFDGANFYPLYLDSAEVKITAPGVSTIQILPSGFLPAVRFLKVRSGTAASPVSQTAARSLALHLIG